MRVEASLARPEEPVHCRYDGPTGRARFDRLILPLPAAYLLASWGSKHTDRHGETRLRFDKNAKVVREEMPIVRVGRFLSCSDLPLRVDEAGEPGLLVFEQLSRGFTDVADGFKG